jgi:hypothetical protein
MFLPSQQHGPRDALTAAVHVHHLTALGTGWGAMTEMNEVHLAVSLLGTLLKALREFLRGFFDLEQGAQVREKPGHL